MKPKEVFKELAKAHLSCMASWVIFFCIITLLVCVIIVCTGKFICNPVENVTVNFALQTDSIGELTLDSKHRIDSLMWVIDVHEKRISDKYEYIIEQRSNIESYMTFGGIILSVILAVFGFFGFRSLHDIEERLRTQIEPHIKSEVEDNLNKSNQSSFNHFKELTNESIKNERELIKNQFDSLKDSTNTNISQNINVLNQQFDSFKITTTDILSKQVSEQIRKSLFQSRTSQKTDIKNEINKLYGETLSSKVQDVENNTSSINILQSEITQLKARLSELENVSYHVQPRRRRSLTEMLGLDENNQVNRENTDPDPFNS